MKRIVEIAVIEDNNGTMMFPCRYDYEGKTFILTSENKMEIFDRTNIKDAPMEVILTLEKRRGPKRYTFEDGADATDEDRNIKEVVDIFWGRYPSAVINGSKIPNPNFKVATLDVMDLNQKASATYEEWVLQRKCADIIELASEEKVRNIGYYYGVTVREMKRNDLIMMLGNWQSGLVHKDTKEFLSIWSGESVDIENRDMLVNVRKAIVIGIITTRAEGGLTNYYINTTCVGTSEDGVMDYLRRNPKLYETHLITDVAKKEAGSIDDFKNEINTANVIKNIAVKGGVSTAQLNALHKEVTIFVSQGFLIDNDYSQKSVEELKTLIANGKAKKIASKTVKI